MLCLGLLTLCLFVHIASLLFCLSETPYLTYYLTQLDRPYTQLSCDQDCLTSKSFQCEYSYMEKHKNFNIFLTFLDGSISCLLRYVDQKAWSDKDCLDSMTGYLYEQYANFSLPTSIMMCGGFPEGGKSTCHVRVQL